MLTVVIPAYNEQETVHSAVEEIGKVLREAQIPYELLFVDDGSKDATWDVISTATSTRPSVRGLHFSRNFGKEAAIYAGLQYAKGDCVAVIDCDLQHPPEKLVEMYRLWQQGYEVVEGIKADRGQETLAHKVSAKTFYAIISKATKIDMTRASDFKLLDRKAVNVLLSMREKRAFFRALSSWVGFKTTEVSYEVRDRLAGESKWSTRSLIRYAIKNITSFTSLPMYLIFFAGCAGIVGAVVYAIVSLVRYLCGCTINGYVPVLIWMFLLSGILMLGIGVIGYYLGCIYEEIQDRPRFIVSEECGNANE